MLCGQIQIYLSPCLAISPSLYLSRSLFLSLSLPSPPTPFDKPRGIKTPPSESTHPPKTSHNSERHQKYLYLFRGQLTCSVGLEDASPRFLLCPLLPLPSEATKPAGWVRGSKERGLENVSKGRGLLENDSKGTVLLDNASKGRELENGSKGRGLESASNGRGLENGSNGRGLLENASKGTGLENGRGCTSPAVRVSRISKGRIWTSTAEECEDPMSTFQVLGLGFDQNLGLGF